ncbi:MAG: MerR family transcriptional regulator [Clostridiales bacterium]|nr:MerR family transcriptional regulator [Clostridiales bacterium]
MKNVCQLCNTTRKALAYYEEKQLISPTVLENGYRDYSSEDIAAIKEISVLRQC